MRPAVGMARSRVSAISYPPVRITWMSRSRIFLRSVLRLTPSRSAARIWLPRVAAGGGGERDGGQGALDLWREAVVGAGWRQGVADPAEIPREVPLDRAREALVGPWLLARYRHRGLGQLAVDDGGGDRLLRIER